MDNEMATITDIENRLCDALLMKARRNNIEYNRKQTATIKECLIELEQKYKTIATHTYIANLLRNRLDNVLIPELLSVRFYNWQLIQLYAIRKIRAAGFSDSYGDYKHRHYTLDKTNSETTTYEPEDTDTIEICEQINAIIPYTIRNLLDDKSPLIKMIDKAYRHETYLANIWHNNFMADDITERFIESLHM